MPIKKKNPPGIISRGGLCPSGATPPTTRDTQRESERARSRVSWHSSDRGYLVSPRPLSRVFRFRHLPPRKTLGRGRGQTDFGPLRRRSAHTHTDKVRRKKRCAAAAGSSRGSGEEIKVCASASSSILELRPRPWSLLSIAQILSTRGNPLNSDPPLILCIHSPSLFFSRFRGDGSLCCGKRRGSTRPVTPPPTPYYPPHLQVYTGAHRVTRYLLSRG